jgi:hypothetical protein
LSPAEREHRTAGADHARMTLANNLEVRYAFPRLRFPCFGFALLASLAVYERPANAACVLIAACLPVAFGQRRASDPEIKLTCLNRDETISKHSSYPITWTAENIPANTMLSLRLNWSAQDSGARAGGVQQKTVTSWLIGGLLDSASQRRLAALSPSATNLPTIESGRYL